MPYESSRGSYVELAQTLRRISHRPTQDLSELFRRMVFNLVAQIDGHTGYQELAILPGQRASNLGLARMAAPQFGLLAGEAEAVIGKIVATVADRIGSAIEARCEDVTLSSVLATFVKQQGRKIGTLE